MDEWIEWPGDPNGPPEIEGLRCDIQFASGEILLNENSYDWWSEWRWDCGEGDRIVAYRNR